jgi:signal transduction histidine kinase
MWGTALRNLIFGQNFRARLIIGAALWISIGLGVSGFILRDIFRSVVARQFDNDLLDHATELASLVDVDPQLKPIVHRDVSDPRFLPERSGLYWQVQFQSGASLRSPSLVNALDLPLGPISESEPIKVDGPTGPMRLVRKYTHLMHIKEPVNISVGVDERLIDEEMKQIQLSLATSLGILALGLFGAAYAQIAFGLRPLSHIRQAVDAVRSGNVKQLPNDLPAEVQPLVTELNGMIAANLGMVERARIQAGNFAHALKLPLAILVSEASELEERGHAEAARVLLEQCSRINLQIDYLTARARASAPQNAGTPSTLGPVIQNVIGAYSRLTQPKRTFEITGPADIVVTCDPHDLTEIIGNLIDNAGKWSRERVVISILDQGHIAKIMIEDDGPGIPVEHRESVFTIGTRLDQNMPGSGLGLAIARDLATLYGGRLWIGDSQLGGAAAHLTLNKIAPI